MITEEDIPAAVSMYRDRMLGLKEIGQHFGTSAKEVARLLRREKVVLRRPGRPRGMVEGSRRWRQGGGAR